MKPGLAPFAAGGNAGGAGGGGGAAQDPARFLALDGMRGIAAIAVVLVHIGYFSGLRWLAPFGFLSVDLFFMISGFVIGYAFEPRLLAGMSWLRFMGFRVARIYPTLLLGLLVGCLAYLIAPPAGYTIGWRSLAHLLLIPDLFGPGIFPLNGVFWTLFFELAVNAVHGLAVRRLTTPRLAAVVLLSAVAWALAALSLGDWGAGWNGSTFFVGGIPRICFGYGAGLLLYRLFGSGAWRIPETSYLLPLGAAALLLALPDFGPPLPRILVSLFLLLPLIVLVSVFARVPPAARTFIQWLAVVSYPLYAIHLPFLVTVRDLAGAGLAPAGWAAAGLACLAVATVLGYFYDIPVRNWLRHRLVPPRPVPRSAGGGPAAPIPTVYSAAPVSRAPGAFLAESWLDLRRSGSIAWRLFRSDLRARRRQNLLGHAWLFIPAAATALVCTYLQRRGIVALQETGLPYPLFVLCGVLLWQSFTDAINAPLQQLGAMRHLITRSRVPHEAVIAAGAAGALLNAAIRCAVLLLVLPFLAVDLSPSLLLMPLGFAALVLLGLGVGLLVSPIGLLYEDVRRALPLATLLWFFLTPVVYPIPQGAGWLRLNPVSPLLEAARSWITAPSVPFAFLAVLAGAALALAAGILLYRVARPHLVARLG